MNYEEYLQQNPKARLVARIMLDGMAKQAGMDKKAFNWSNVWDAIHNAGKAVGRSRVGRATKNLLYNNRGKLLAGAGVMAGTGATLSGVSVYDTMRDRNRMRELDRRVYDYVIPGMEPNRKTMRELDKRIYEYGLPGVFNKSASLGSRLGSIGQKLGDILGNGAGKVNRGIRRIADAGAEAAKTGGNIAGRMGRQAGQEIGKAAKQTAGFLAKHPYANATGLFFAPRAISGAVGAVTGRERPVNISGMPLQDLYAYPFQHATGVLKHASLGKRAFSFGDVLDALKKGYGKARRGAGAIADATRTGAQMGGIRARNAGVTGLKELGYKLRGAAQMGGSELGGQFAKLPQAAQAGILAGAGAAGMAGLQGLAGGDNRQSPARRPLTGYGRSRSMASIAGLPRFRVY